MKLPQAQEGQFGFVLGAFLDQLLQPLRHAGHQGITGPLGEFAQFGLAGGKLGAVAQLEAQQPCFKPLQQEPEGVRRPPG